jgi:hypothetical protein
MTRTAPEMTREEPPRVADERAMLDAWLDFHRQTLLWKCAGLVRHMVEVERGWFRHGFARDPVSNLYCSDERPEANFEDVNPDDAGKDIATFSIDGATGV